MVRHLQHRWAQVGHGGSNAVPLLDRVLSSPATPLCYRAQSAHARVAAAHGLSETTGQPELNLLICGQTIAINPFSRLPCRERKCMENVEILRI